MLRIIQIYTENKRLLYSILSMKIKKLKQTLLALLFGISSFAPLVVAPVSYAETAITSPYSWDQGLYATRTTYNDSVHAWGQRKTTGAWGTGPVNYQSGATTNYRGYSSGSVEFTMKGTYCPSSCSYGSGSGYKGLVQFWNDTNNYIAFGLIHDPGVSPTGTTLMVEGAANGKPVGGYWGANGISGAAHYIKATWTGSVITFNMDNNVSLSYPVKSNQPSISFLAAARNTGDIADTTFNGINFSAGSINPQVIPTPSGSPYATYSATIKDGGSGTGHSAYINMHDAHSNAIGVGIQTDTAAPETSGQPYFIWQRVQGGVFTYQYIKPATTNPTDITLKWWKNEKLAIFYEGTTKLATVPLNLEPRLFFNAEGNARLNGDSVNSTVQNTQITVGDSCPTYCGLNGSWNTSSFNFYGLTATNTNGQPQNGANFSITGTASGIPAGLDWDTTPDPVGGIGMIAQYWNGL